MSNIPTYNDCKHGRQTPDYLHPLLEDILKPTYGVIIYQEQVMQIAQKLSGFTAGQADLLRRAMGKKKRAELEKQKQGFIAGALKNGIAKDVAAGIFLKIEQILVFCNKICFTINFYYRCFCLITTNRRAEPKYHLQKLQQFQTMNVWKVNGLII